MSSNLVRPFYCDLYYLKARILLIIFRVIKIQKFNSTPILKHHDHGRNTEISTITIIRWNFNQAVSANLIVEESVCMFYCKFIVYCRNCIKERLKQSLKSVSWEYYWQSICIEFSAIEVEFAHEYAFDFLSE